MGRSQREFQKEGKEIISRNAQKLIHGNLRSLKNIRNFPLRKGMGREGTEGREERDRGICMYTGPTHCCATACY